MHNLRQNLARIYSALFLVYLIAPLLVMAGAAFNDSKLPSIVPWKGWTLRWFSEMAADDRMMLAFINTLWVAAAVALLAVIVGTASAILINSISGRVRTVIYGLMISTILIPGVVIGISTMLLWTKVGNALDTEFFLFGAGLHLSVLWQVSRRILLPHLYPAIGAGAAVAFFQSIENYNVTQFTRGGADTLTVYVFSKVRSGITPTINALAVIMIGVTILAAILYELRRRRQERLMAALAPPEE